MAPEVGIVRTYLDWILDLPWMEMQEENLDVPHAAAILNEDHYGLEKIKDRILEFIAVKKIAADKMRTPILCFVGPPGTGKTSLGRSIARALGREFIRVSLGGVRDEAEIRVIGAPTSGPCQGASSKPCAESNPSTPSSKCLGRGG